MISSAPLRSYRFALLWSLDAGGIDPSERHAAHNVAPVLLSAQIIAPQIIAPFPRQNAELYDADIQAALIRRRVSGDQPMDSVHVADRKPGRIVQRQDRPVERAGGRGRRALRRGELR